jgi:hypothetical protein
MNFFRMIQRDHAEKSWFFWVYFDGLPGKANSIESEIVLLGENGQAVLSHKEDVVPLDISLLRVNLKLIFLAFLCFQCEYRLRLQDKY